MNAFKWSSVFLLVILFFGCGTTLQREVKLLITSEPPNAKIYEEGELIGDAPLNLSYRYEVYGELGGYSIFPGNSAAIRALLRPRSFTALKDGFKPQTKSFQFSSPYQELFAESSYVSWSRQPDFFTQPEFSLLFALEPLESKSQQQQQQQQQQQVTVVIPGGDTATKSLVALTIMTTPAQAEVYIDGAFVATTPVPSLQLEAGPHKIEIQKSGYKTWARTMQLLPNSPVKIEVELEKI
jgi:hypothetical protein